MTHPRTVVVVGGSRGLGLGAVQEFLDRGWRVIATVRGETPAPLAELGRRHGERLQVVRADVTHEPDIQALNSRLEPGSIDVLYLNAGITGEDLPVGQVSTEEFTRVMVTNALAPMRVAERLAGAVRADGAIVWVSSRQGSVSLNTRGGHEVYRASKAALNQLVRSYAARGQYPERTLLLMHPGWVQTPLGGAGAPLTVAQSARGLVDVVEAHAADGGLQFLDHTGHIVAW